MAIGEERRAHAGAEGEGHLDAFALDGAVTLDGGVVGDADGFLPALFQLPLEGVADPMGWRLAAEKVKPCLMTPGNPTETRSKPGRRERSLPRPLRTARGVAISGVGRRWRSLTGLPAGSRSMALRPEPPMSMVRVTGRRHWRQAGLANLGDPWILRAWESSQGEL